MSTDEKALEEFLKANMPSIEELAPEEYKELIGAYGKIQDKYAAKAKELMKEKGFEEEAGEKLYAPGAAVVGGVIVVVVAAQVYDKYTGGEKTGG